jgi:hypothetical protein
MYEGVISISYIMHENPAVEVSLLFPCEEPKSGPW